MQYYTKDRVIFPMPDEERDNYEAWADERDEKLERDSEIKRERGEE